MAKVKVTRCEHVDDPYYKMLVENPFIRTEHPFDSVDDANKFINDDIDKYIADNKDNDIVSQKIEIPWQVGASLTDRSRFGGLNIMYHKTQLSDA